MYSAASPRLMIHSASGGGTTPKAMFCAYTARVARILALHEDAVAAEDRGCGAAFGHLAIGEVDLGVDAEAADDAGDRVPGHLHQLPRAVGHGVLSQGVVRRHDGSLSRADFVK